MSEEKEENAMDEKEEECENDNRAVEDSPSPPLRNTALHSMRNPARAKSQTPSDEPTLPCSSTPNFTAQALSDQYDNAHEDSGFAMAPPNPSLSLQEKSPAWPCPETSSDNGYDSAEDYALGTSGSFDNSYTESMHTDSLHSQQHHQQSVPSKSSRSKAKHVGASLRKKLFGRNKNKPEPPQPTPDAAATFTNVSTVGTSKKRWRRTSKSKASLQHLEQHQVANEKGYVSDGHCNDSNSNVSNANSALSASFANWTTSSSAITYKSSLNPSSHGWHFNWVKSVASHTHARQSQPHAQNDDGAAQTVTAPPSGYTSDGGASHSFFHRRIKKEPKRSRSIDYTGTTLETFQPYVESQTDPPTPKNNHSSFINIPPLTSASTKKDKTSVAQKLTSSNNAPESASTQNATAASNKSAHKSKTADKNNIDPPQTDNTHATRENFTIFNTPQLRKLLKQDLVHIHSAIHKGDAHVKDGEGFYSDAIASYNEALQFLFTWILNKEHQRQTPPPQHNQDEQHEIHDKQKIQQTDDNATPLDLLITFRIGNQDEPKMEPTLISDHDITSKNTTPTTTPEAFFTFLDQWWLNQQQGNPNQTVLSTYSAVSSSLSVMEDNPLPSFSDTNKNVTIPTVTPHQQPQPVQLHYNDMLLLLRVIASTFMKLGNTHFHSRQFEDSIVEYNHARRCLDQKQRRKIILDNDDVGMNKNEPNDITTIGNNFHLEDSILDGQALTNIASAYAGLNSYEQATSRYAESLKIKRFALRHLLEGKNNNKDSLPSQHTKTSQNQEREEGQTGSSFHNDNNVVLDIARTLHNIGLLRFHQKYYTKAQDAYKQALALRVEKCGLDHLSVASTLNNLGDVYFADGDYDVALRSYLEVLRVRKLCLGSKHSLVGTTWHNIGLVHYMNGPYAKSRSALMDALRIRRQTLGDSHPDLASTLHLLGVVLTTMGELDDAMRCLFGALRIRRRVLGGNKKREKVLPSSSSNNTSDIPLRDLTVDIKNDNNDNSDQSGGTAENNLLVLNTKLAIGTVHRKRGDLEEALSSFRSVLRYRMRQLGNEHSSVAEALQAIAAACRDANEHEKAVEVLQEALRIFNECLGKESLEAAETMTLLALSFIKLGQHEESDKLCTEALRIIELKAGKEHILYAQGLRVLGDLRQERAEYEKALEAYDHVIRVSARWHDTKHLDVGDTFNAVGNACFKNGDFEKAEDSFTEALRIKRLWLDDDNVSIFITLNNLGHTHYKNKDLDQALKSYTESLYLQLKRLSGRSDDHIRGPDLVSTTREVMEEINAGALKDDEIKDFSSAIGVFAATLRNVALVHQDKGDLEKALNIYELALIARKAQPHRDNPAIASTAETIGMLQFKKGNHDAAMIAFHEALEVKKEHQGNDTIDVARTLNNLANMHFSKGNLEEAMTMYLEALEIKRLRLGTDSEDVANTLNNIAHVMFTSGREEESLQAYSEVLRIRQTRQGADSIAVGVTLGNMGDVHVKQGNLAMARTCLEQSLQIRKIQQRQNYAENARVSESLAHVYGKLGEWSKAEIAYSDTLLLKQAQFGMDHLEVAKTLELLAVSKIEQSRHDEALPHLLEALRIRKLHSGPSQDDIVDALNRIAFVHKQCGNLPELLEVYSEIEEITNEEVEANSSEEVSDEKVVRSGTCFEV